MFCNKEVHSVYNAYKIEYAKSSGSKRQIELRYTREKNV